MSEVLLAGRDEHPAFGPAWTGDGPLFRWLSRYQKRLAARLADIRRDLIQVIEDIPFPLEDFEAGYTIQTDFVDLRGGQVHFISPQHSVEPLSIVSWENRLSPDRVWYGAYVQGGVLSPLGIPRDWMGVEKISLWLFPRLADITSRESEFALPGDPLDVLVAQAARFLAGRAPAASDPPIDVLRFVAQAEEAQELYIDQVTRRRIAKVGGVRDVW